MTKESRNYLNNIRLYPMKPILYLLYDINTTNKLLLYPFYTIFRHKIIILL